MESAAAPGIPTRFPGNQGGGFHLGPPSDVSTLKTVAQPDKGYSPIPRAGVLLGLGVSMGSQEA